MRLLSGKRRSIRRHIGKVLAILALTGGAPLSAQRAPATTPETPGSVASATRLVTLLKIDGVLDTMFQQITPLITNGVIASIEKAPDAPAPIKSRLADPGLRPQAERIMSEEVLKAYRVRYPEILASAARHYAAAFSEADLQAAIAFYQSPAGRHFIEAQAGMQAVMGEEGRRIGLAAGQAAVPAALARITALPAPAH